MQVTSRQRFRDESGARRRDGVLAAVARAIAARIHRAPDRSLANVKFTDALERELLERTFRPHTF